MRRLQLWGYPALLVDGEALTGPVTQRHRLALLALLALSPDRTLPRDKIFALLWPDSDTANARHLLNTAVSVIRSAAGESLIISRRDEIALSPQVSVDVLEFQALANNGDAASASKSYRAAFLDGFYLERASEFEQWASRERARLIATYRRAMESAADVAERDGNLPVALQWWWALTHDDPYNTRAVMRLMLALERSGDHGNALQLAQEHEALLARDFEAEPANGFRELVLRIRERPNGVSELSLSPSAVVTGVPPGADDVVTTPPSESVARRTARRHIFVALAMVALPLAAATLKLVGRPDLVPSRVVISRFENASGDSSFNLVASNLTNAIMRGATRVPIIEVIDLEAFAADSSHAPISLARVRSEATRAGAGSVVRGSITATRGDSLRVAANITDLRSGRVLRAVHASLSGADARVHGIDRVGERVLGALAMVFDERLSTITTASDREPSLDSYRAFLVGLDAFARGEYEDAYVRFLQLAADDESFTTAMVWAAFASYHGARFARADSMARVLASDKRGISAADRFGLEWLTARLRGDLPAAYRAAREAARLAPRSQWAHSYADAALEMRRPAESVEALSPLGSDSSWLRGWTGFRSVLASAYHLRGRYRDEYALARQSRRHRTNLYVQLISEARPLAAMGRAAELTQLIDEALSIPDQPNMDPGSLMQRAARELRAHGYADAARPIFERAVTWYNRSVVKEPEVGAPRWALGNMLYALGKLDTAEQVYRGMESRAVAYRVHGHLGMVAARLGRHAEAATFDSLLTLPRPRMNAFDASLRVFYRACIAALENDRARAMALLQEAVAMGVPVPLDSIHIDEALATLRGLPAFDQLVRIQGIP